jgi:hypothetical protein
VNDVYFSAACDPRIVVSVSDADGVNGRRGSIASTLLSEALMLQPTDLSRHSISIWLLLVFSMIAVATTAKAQVVPPPGAEGLVRRGDAVVTGFAATLPPGPDLPIDVHPLDRTG